MQQVATLIMMALSQSPQKTLRLSELRHHHLIKHLGAYHIVDALSHLKDTNEVRVYYKGISESGVLSEESWETPSQIPNEDAHLMHNLVTIITMK